MSRGFRNAAVAVAGLCLLASSVPAQVTDPNKDEQKCESGVGKTLGKFVSSKSKCISKCIQTGRKTSGPYAGCFPPGYTDAATNTCIFDPAKGAEAKSTAGIAKGCSKDCPECYSAGQCAGTQFTTEVEGDIDAPFGPGTGFPDLIYCVEKAGGTPTKDQAKCEDGVVKALVKFIGSKSKCYDKCFGNFYKGKIPAGQCEPSSPGDPATNACIFDPAKGAEAKAVAAINKACPTPPPCYAAGFANTFVSAAESKADARAGHNEINCGSPSGAFVN